MNSMITVAEFMNEEGGNFTKQLLLNTIDEGKKNGKFKDQFGFNRYYVDIFYQDNKVEITDDIFPENEPLVLSIDKFVKALLEQ